MIISNKNASKHNKGKYFTVRIMVTVTYLTMVLVNGLVIFWAYAGILIKHISSANFAGQYPAVITTAIICIIILFLAKGYLLYNIPKKAV